jgi:plastocyanin
VVVRSPGLTSTRRPTDNRCVRVLLAIAVVMLLAPAGDAISLRRQCRLECGDAIEACVRAGKKRPRCRRQVLKRCRRRGLATCVPAGLPGSTTTTTQAGETSTTTTPGGGGGTTTTTLPMVNGCDQATDLRHQATVEVHFQSYSYDPACFIVSPGTTVTFDGDFTFHPLRGGVVADGVQTPDPASPFEPGTSTGTSKSFVLSEAGTRPFYCEAHGVIGMSGAAYVVP